MDVGEAKRFAWTLGLVLSLSMTVITNSGIRDALPRTICVVCLTLMWMESVPGVCPGCRLAGVLARRGWLGDDPGFDACALDGCKPVDRAAGAGGGG